ncbi:MAG: hypothetical protein EOP86_00135 [Verrucomicrobiaceae bacterium]|nr:MAG: hypothetical protein EOP86_00135 [Verrucomicrobiaceae bacterium]
MAQNLPRGTPARVLVLLTLLTGLVVVSAWRDALQRDRAVWLNYPTALGDNAYCRLDQFPVRVKAEGQVVRLAPADGKVLRLRDDRMFRLRPGPGDSLPFQLYTAVENPASTSDAPLYARTGPGQFIQLQAGLEDKNRPLSAAPDTSLETPRAPGPAQPPAEP